MLSELTLICVHEVRTTGQAGYWLPASAAANGIRNVNRVSMAFDETLRVPPWAFAISLEM